MLTGTELFPIRNLSAGLRALPFFRLLCGSLVGVVAGIALLGWIFNAPALATSADGEYPMEPTTAFILSSLSVSHLCYRALPRLARSFALGALLLLVAQTLLQLGRVPLALHEVAYSLLGIASPTGNLSFNGVVGLFALSLGHLCALTFPRSARAQTLVIALSLLAIGVSILALVGYSTSWRHAFAWDGAGALAPNAAAMILVLGISMAHAAWVVTLPLTVNFEAIQRELRFIVLTFFLAIVGISSGIALVAVYEAQVSAHRDVLLMFTSSAHQRLETYFQRLTTFSDALRSEYAPGSRRARSASNLLVTIPELQAEATSLGLRSVGYATVTSLAAPIRAPGEVDSYDNHASHLRIENNSLSFFRTVPGKFPAVELQILLPHIQKIISGRDVALLKDLAMTLTPSGSSRILHSRLGGGVVEVVELDRPEMLWSGEEPQLVSDTGREIPITSTVSIRNPPVKLQVEQVGLLSVAPSRSDFLWMLSSLVVLAALGSTILMHLVTKLGDRSSQLGLQLSTAVHQLETEIQERERSSTLIYKANKEKEVLLREIHHRVKNNLQIISSIFSLKLRRTDNTHVRTLLQEAQGRLEAISLLHQTLYRSGNLSEIQMIAYIKEVVGHIMRSYGAQQRVKLDITSDNEHISIESAIPLGLIITELLTNSVKYAWPESSASVVQSSAPAIALDLRKIDDTRARLEYADNGVGLPSNFDISGTASLGMKLVTTLVKQLRGELVLRQGLSHGVSFTIMFPLQFQEAEKNETSACANS
jgi:two-component sensor histidine kinase